MYGYHGSIVCIAFSLLSWSTLKRHSFFTLLSPVQLEKTTFSITLFGHGFKEGTDRETQDKWAVDPSAYGSMFEMVA